MKILDLVLRHKWYDMYLTDEGKTDWDQWHGAFQLAAAGHCPYIATCNRYKRTMKKKIKTEYNLNLTMKRSKRSLKIKKHNNPRHRTKFYDCKLYLREPIIPENYRVTTKNLQRLHVYRSPNERALREIDEMFITHINFITEVAPMYLSKILLKK